MPRNKSSEDRDLQFEEISNPFLPKDWKRVIVKRQTGRTKDLVDIYVIASDGTKLRSSREFLKHLSKTKTKTPFRMNADECVALFKKAYLKAENFAQHNLLIKLVPSLASESQRKEMGIILPVKKRGRPKKIPTVENFAHQDLLSNSAPTSGKHPQEENFEICLQPRKRGRPKKVVAVENVANQNQLIKSGNKPQPESLGMSIKPKKRGRPKKNYAAEKIDNQNQLPILIPTSESNPQKGNVGISIMPRKRGRPKSSAAAEKIDNQNQLPILIPTSESNPQKGNVGISIMPRKRGRPKSSAAAEKIDNQNQLPILIPTSESNPQKGNVGISIMPRKRGRPKSSAAAKHFVLINQQSKLVTTLGKEPKIFKRRKRRWGSPKKTASNAIVSLSKNEIEKKSTEQHETRANKSVQTDDFLFTFKNESNNVQSYDCINSQDNLRVIENVSTKMVFTRFETGDVSVPKRFTYLPSSISKMKWDSVSGTYAIDVDGKVIPSLICNDEEYARLEDQAPSENSLSLSPDIKDVYDSDINIEDFEDSKMCEIDAVENYFIDHSCAVTICHRPKTRVSTWIPPKSPYNIIQQLLYDDPWKLLISTFFEECHDSKHFWEFTDKWPSAKELLRVNVRTLADFLQECGIHRLRAGTFLKFTDDFLHSDWVDPTTLFGIRNFGKECYILFYLGEWQTFKPKSGMLKLYLNWYNENFVDK